MEIGSIRATDTFDVSVQDAGVVYVFERTGNGGWTEAARLDLAAGGEGVEIAAVDFGAHTGPVFYVSGGKSAGRSAVVWITDAGGE